MKKFTSIVAGFIFQFHCFSQPVVVEEGYVPETDPLVLEKLEQWRDLKFGLMMHWGTYSVWSIGESWSICPEECDWCMRKDVPEKDDYFAYKKEYEALIKTFDPVKFDPEKWAQAAKNAGMRYLVFTTKHHDGFCMFDTKYTNYKITSSDCPFSVHPRADVTGEIFRAFREQDFWVGAYFSKPDWNTPYYWNPKYPPRDRNVNYDPATDRGTWNKFVAFTHNQVIELMTDYGKLDILWLDGSWVSGLNPDHIPDMYRNEVANSKSRYLNYKFIDQDIRMDELVKKAREKQPGLIAVDRGVYGKNQNYLTFENRVPEKRVYAPWESCMVSGNNWSYNPNAVYMSGSEGINLLVDIVAKGGNLLLNIAPSSEGRWHPDAYKLLQEYGDWMKVNAEAIYNSRPLDPYREDNISMTQQKNGNAYFFYHAVEGETQMPASVNIATHVPKPGASVSILNVRKNLKWKKNDLGFTIMIPDSIRNNPPCKYVWTFKVSTLK